MNNTEDLYFKDVFTETENGIDMEANQLKINCITSNQNKFHLDSEGNLTVNSITTTQRDTTSSDLYYHLYPIGSIYISVDSTNPATYFGGSWEQIRDVFLLGAGNTYTGGTTGGEATHQLSVLEMPSHNHTMLFTFAGSGSGTGIPYSGSTSIVGGDATPCQHTGGNQAHNNMPPYLTVYMWKRVA